MIKNDQNDQFIIRQSSFADLQCCKFWDLNDFCEIHK